MTILITRPQESAHKTAETLERKGYQTFIEPLLEISPVTPTPYDTVNVQAILFTSTHGVRFCPDADKLAHLPVFAVGPSTAEEAHKRGFQNINSVHNGASKGLCALIASHLHSNDGGILYFSGKDLATDSVELLMTYGYSTQRIVVYEAHPAISLSPACQEALLSSQIKAALFFSPRTLSTFAILIEKARLTHCCASITAICLSESIQKEAGSLPFQTLLCADTPRTSSILSLVERHFTSLISATEGRG